MRALFSLAGLLVVLMIIAALALRQGREAAPARPVTDSANTTVPVVTPGNAAAIQQQFRTDLESALQAAQRDIPE